MSVRVLLVSGRTEIEESLREDPGAHAYWVERRPPDLVVPAEVAREFAIAIVDFDTCPDGLAMARSLRASKGIEVIAVAGPEQERPAVESLRSGIYDYVLWPGREPSTLWGMLAGCAKKVQPAEPEFPIEFGHYTLLSRLGVGGMAEVFLAETGTPPRKLVVKRMLHSLAGDEFVAMFMDEARISSMLLHPNIVRVHDFGRVDESLYIAMEYVPGRNLEQLRLALGGPFPPSIACYIVAEMCAGLGHAHTKSDASGEQQGIVHRDVNPPNVLIADDGRVMITDFGIAKAANRYYETSSGTLKGKFEYMSPEQANGRAVDRRADIFCVGLVLYELLTGTRPFMAATPIETLFLIQECKPVAPSYWNARLPKVLDDICMKALAKDPGARYQESSEMERDLREVARGSMNPGPRDLATFTRSVARAEPSEIPELPTVAGGPPSGPATISDGKVTALLQHKKKKEEGKTGDGPTLSGEGPTAPVRSSGLVDSKAPAAKAVQPSSKLSPLVAAALEEETPARPTPMTPRPAPVAPPPESAPVDPPHLRREPARAVLLPALPSTQPPAESADTRTITAEARAVSFAQEPTPTPTPAPSTSRDETVPGVLADLERLLEDEAPPASASATNGATVIVPAGALPQPQPPPPPAPPERTISAELFPLSAKDKERDRFRMQLAGGIGGGLVLAILTAVFVVPRIGSLAGGSPTPYPTPFAMLSPTSTAVAVLPSLTAEPLVASPTPVASLPVATASPAAVASPTPSRTAVAMATASATPVRPVAKGTLSVWVDGWATVEIDGRPAGNAPFVGVPLTAGKHRLVLTNGAKVRREVEVVVQAGKEAKYSVSFSRTP